MYTSDRKKRLGERWPVNHEWITALLQELWAESISPFASAQAGKALRPILNQYLPHLLPMVDRCEFTKFDLGRNPPTIIAVEAIHTTKLDPWNTEIVLDVSFHWSHSGEFELELQRTKKALGQVEDHVEEYGHARDKKKEPIFPELSDGKEGRIYLRIKMIAVVRKMVHISLEAYESKHAGTLRAVQIPRLKDLRLIIGQDPDV